MIESEEARTKLIQQLKSYHGCDTQDGAMARQICELVEANPRCAERDCFPAHLTGSAWVVNRSGSKVILLHHRKLDRWLQPGGHADGEFDLRQVALREAREESGLSTIIPIDDVIFDLDIHKIPALHEHPEHLHFDLRFLCVGDEDESIVVSAESHDVRWVALQELARYTQESSIVRMHGKWLARRGVQKTNYTP